MNPITHKTLALLERHTFLQQFVSGWDDEPSHVVLLMHPRDLYALYFNCSYRRKAFPSHFRPHVRGEDTLEFAGLESKGLFHDVHVFSSPLAPEGHPILAFNYED